MTHLSTYLYAKTLAEHFGAITFWLSTDQPAFLPWAVIDGDALVCSCGLTH